MTRDPAWGPRLSVASQPLDHQGIPNTFFLKFSACGWGHCASLLLISQPPLSLSEHILSRNALLTLSPLTFFKSFFPNSNDQLFCWWLDKWQLNSFHVHGRISSLKLALRASQEPHHVSLIGTHCHFPRWLWQKASYVLKPFAPLSPFLVLAKTLAHLSSRN